MFLASQFQTTELAAVHPAPCDREPSLVSRIPDPSTRTRSYSTPDAQLSKDPLGPSAPEAVESRNTLGPAASSPTAKSFIPCSLQHCRTSTCSPSTRKLSRRYPPGSDTRCSLRPASTVTPRAPRPARTAPPAKCP